MTFKCVPKHDGAIIEFEHRTLLGRRKVPYAHWGNLAHGQKSTLRFLSHAVSAGELVAEEFGLIASAGFILSLNSAQANSLGVPKQLGLSVSIAMHGRVDDSDSTLLVTWYDHNSRPVMPHIQGPFLRIAGEWGLLSRPLYEVHLSAREFNSSAGKSFDERLPHWQRFQDTLKAKLGEGVEADRFVASLTIFQAGAFGLDIRETANGPDFLPVLMARAPDEELGEIDDENDAPETDGDDAISWVSGSERRSNDTDALLPPALQSSFYETSLSRPGQTEAAYVLARNTYLLIDPPLRTALDVVKKMRGAATEDRKSFLRNPRTRIAMALGDDGEATAASLFVETAQYSDRIEGLGLWEKPKLPWIKRAPNQWLPEQFSVKIGSKILDATPEKIEQLHILCTDAEQDKLDEISFEDVSYPTDDVRTMLNRLDDAGSPYVDLGSEEQQPEQRNISAKADRETDRDVLRIKENLEELDYHSNLSRRGNLVPLRFPLESINGTKPKKHQLQGFEWLCGTWTAGWPGVLLADDMGLGKTFQALSFLAWIKENMSARRGAYRPLQGPFLIVAPTSLLDNWKKEAEIHLKPGQLGICAEAFGSALKGLKMPRGPHWSEEDALNVDYLRQADWVLTTYETLALYHRSFARVAYSVAIFDEMQKVKSPDSINSHTAKTMNADFVIGMTGTPIENRLEDLWCIMDRIAPGYLGDLKNFSRSYGEENPTALTELKAKLDKPQGSAPAIMLRRMKDDVAKDLPHKFIHSYHVAMPKDQADAYDEAVAAAKASAKTRKGMLETLHKLRGISLHPERGEDADAYDTASRSRWFNGSARLQKTISLLEDIRGKGEKALVFLEDRAMQTAFAAAVSEHFQLDQLPRIINGTTQGRDRQRIVDAFQTAPQGFDLLILSPKAAGIGLTITAANHVIHLSRWWNPAVEDQCNDRAFRIGQTKEVNIHLPLAIHPTHREGSFDQRLHDLLERKRRLSRDMLAPPTSERDIDNLFGDIIG